MSTLTSGHLLVKPLRAHFSGDIGAIAALAAGSLYPSSPTQPSVGWGSILDNEDAVNTVSAFPLAPAAPQVLPATADLPERLRMRYYYDESDPRLSAAGGPSATWGQTHYRRAIDFIIFDGDTKNGFPVVAAMRNSTVFNRIVVKALKALESSAQLESDLIPETLSPDFYQWLLYRLHTGGVLAPGIQLEAIDEMSASDRLVKRGSKFSNDAPLDRADLAALLAIGNSHFGPAKLAITDVAVDAMFAFELHLDGGFAVFRAASSYDSATYTTVQVGSALVEDLWWRVLPKIRAVYNADTTWRSSGASTLRELAFSNLATALNCEIKPVGANQPTYKP